MHYNFGIDNLNHRMVFTACALVAKRYGAVLVKEMNWNTLHGSILPTLENSYEEAKIKNTKLDILSDEYKTNVLENADNGAICAFILPDTKLKVNKNIVIKWLTKHTLQKIIKLPDVFSGMANVRTSIFIFKAHQPQIIQTVENNQRVLKSKKDIFSCWIQDDGLETVKNQGRHDVNNVWKAKEDCRVDVIYKQSGDETIQWLNPLEHLSYQISKPDFIISNKDINKVSLNYILFMKNYLITSHKKGISSLQLSKDLHVTQKTAWFMLQRIRKCFEVENNNILCEQVEADETYIGGKNKNRHKNKKVENSIKLKYKR